MPGRVTPGHPKRESQSQARGEREAQSRHREVLMAGVRERLLFWDSRKDPWGLVRDEPATVWPCRNWAYPSGQEDRYPIQLPGFT